jgi:uncharacterized membrane protein (GlpM family)
MTLLATGWGRRGEEHPLLLLLGIACVLLVMVKRKQHHRLGDLMPAAPKFAISVHCHKSKWVTTNKLVLNLDKTNVMKFATSNSLQ